MRKTILLTLLILAVWGWQLAPPASSQEPMAVTLGDFTLTAVPTSNTIHVRADWDTHSEQDTAGFLIRRGQGSNVVAISPIIPAVGDFSQGADYTFMDTTAVSGQTYIYQLVEITTGSEQHVVRELTFTVSVAVTNTPAPLGGGNNGGTQPTNTTVPPTATVAATVVVVATATPQPTATNAAPTAVPTIQPTTAAALPTATNPPFVVPSFPTAAPPVNEENSGANSGSNGGILVIAPTLIAENFGAAAVQASQTTTETTDPATETTVSTTTLPDQPDSGTAQIAAVPNNAATPIVIGRTPLIPNTTPPQQTEPSQESRLGDLYLWGGFIAAMILFAAAVLGSIILFTRKREP